MTIPRPSPAIPEALLLFAVVFSPLAFGAVETWARAILETDLLALAALTALTRRAPRRYLTDGTVLAAALALLALGVFQLLNPRLPFFPATWAPFTVSRPATARALRMWGAYAALLWAAPRLLARPGASSRLAWTIFATGALVAVIGILQLGQGNTAYYGLRHVRWGAPFGPFVNRDHAAAFLSMSFWTGLGLFAARLTGLRRRETVGEISDLLASQALVLFLLATVAAGMVMTKSRGAFNAFFLSAGVMALAGAGFIQRRGKRWAAYGALGAAVLAFPLFLLGHRELIGGVLWTPDVSTAYRLSMYRSSISMLKDFPLWGIGAGAVKVIFPMYQEPMLVGFANHVHSDWLELLLQTGVFGGLIMAAGLGSFFLQCRQGWRAQKSLPQRLLTAGLLGGALGFIAHLSVEFAFQIPADAVMGLCLMMLAGASEAASVRRFE